MSYLYCKEYISIMYNVHNNHHFTSIFLVGLDKQFLAVFIKCGGLEKQFPFIHS